MTRDRFDAGALAGSGSVTWANILPAGGSAPAVGGIIRATHLTSLRTEMNNALAAVGAPTDASPAVAAGQTILRSHLVDLQRKAQ